MRTQIASRTGFEEGISYRVVPCAPPPPAAETDTEARALELIVLWGDESVLAVEHIAPGRSFDVSELGLPALQVVEARGEDSVVLVPTGASCVLEPPNAALQGAREITLARGQSVRISHGGFHFLVREEAAGKRIGVGGAPELQLKRHTWTLASFSAHALLLVLVYFLPPSSTALSVDALHNDPRFAKYLMVPVSIDPPEPELSAMPDDDGADPGKRAKGDAGKAGEKAAKPTNNRQAVKGPKENKEVVLPRETSKAEAANGGIIGLLRSQVGMWNAPSSRYGAQEAIGADPVSAIGALFGPQIGMNGGQGGLHMIGSGRGGGGEAIGTPGVGRIGTTGRGIDGEGGYGARIASLQGRNGRVPRISSPTADIAGSLSKEVIRRQIGLQISKIRHCYTQALNVQPELQGRVAVRFVISPTGTVMKAVVASSDLRDAQTEQCIVDVVSRMSFPAPEGGLVVVTYPFVLQQVGN